MRGLRMWAELCLMLIGYAFLWVIWFAMFRLAGCGWVTSGVGSFFAALLSVGLGAAALEWLRSNGP